jgi:hypothetical protein
MDYIACKNACFWSSSSHWDAQLIVETMHKNMYTPPCLFKQLLIHGLFCFLGNSDIWHKVVRSLGKPHTIIWKVTPAITPLLNLRSHHTASGPIHNDHDESHCVLIFSSLHWLAHKTCFKMPSVTLWKTLFASMWKWETHSPIKYLFPPHEWNTD